MRRTFQRHALGPLRAGLASILEGLAYARSRPELIGNLAVEIVAAAFARPMALFPALAVPWGGARAVGYPPALSVRALMPIVFSGWTARVDRCGAGAGGAGVGLARPPRRPLSPLPGTIRSQWPVSAVIGSITDRTRAITLAGNPPSCACRRTISSSGAR
jgi:hypothetical protein